MATSVVSLTKKPEEREIQHLKPPVPASALEHKNLLERPDFRRIPAYRDVTDEQFLDHHWQAKKSITRPDKLLEALQGLASEAFIKDATEGFARAPMSVRVSPYVMSLIDWNDPYNDPLRTQFIPIASRMLPDHPKLGLDSLHEQEDAPVPGLTHRYYDKALFLPLDTCPVYCRFCTRSYAVGNDTELVDKVHLRVDIERWAKAFQYISERPELEDIVVSGGDAYQLRPDQLRHIGETLVKLDNIRRIRIATKGPAVMPQKVLTDVEWLDAVTHVVDLGRKLHKEVVLHTHFNHPNEITGITRDAMLRLFERGITVRNQSVLIRNVNDSPETMRLLVKRLGHVHVHPYYVYVHDMVKGAEDLRTTVQTGIDIEKYVRGSTAGFNTPTFVVDAPGGGGKRVCHSYEHYDRTTGISVFHAPSVKAGQHFLYFDPIDRLPEAGRARWADPAEHAKMVDEAIEATNAKLR
ncbi:MAG: KamA family radical SAM protein [Polyangiaceae bacterium]|nr:KamA family radical SAM protein [Polyangiaceae bacterium]